MHALAVGSGLSLRFATSLHYFWFLSETLKFGRSHITCQDVRHASWGSIECDLCWECDSSVKVCGTHLRMNKRERVCAWHGMKGLSCNLHGQ